MICGYGVEWFAARACVYFIISDGEGHETRLFLDPRKAEDIATMLRKYARKARSEQEHGATKPKPKPTRKAARRG